MITEIKLQNPHASKPLVIDLNIECNTPEEKIYSNILTNSARPNEWAKAVNPHHRKAIICGSSPSIKDYLNQIKESHACGGDIFALNGCAKFLYENGIFPDFQVIMDAQPRTKELIGPANVHMFASQVDPSLFDEKPSAVLWHATYGDKIIDELEGFPKRDDYCIIGSAATVGNTTLALVYAMGYREIEVYGMDSSHKDGEGHAFHQTMNEGDPCTIVEYNGKKYICSFTMKLQADTFMRRVKDLKAAGCEIKVFGDGLIPDMFNNPMPEEEKYKRMWEFGAYRQVAPGEDCAQIYIDKFHPYGKVIDFGCGTGRGALKLKESGCDMLLLDFTENSRDAEAMSLPFKRVDLTESFEVPQAEYGYCTDVMEHIEPEKVAQVILNIMSKVNKCFFQISTVPDTMGELIGQDLHLTVKPLSWWEELFINLGYNVEWSEEQTIAALFFVTKAQD